MRCDRCDEKLGVGGDEHKIEVGENQNLTHFCPDCWNKS
jgi:hypothetical protein